MHTNTNGSVSVSVNQCVEYAGKVIRALDALFAENSEVELNGIDYAQRGIVTIAFVRKMTCLSLQEIAHIFNISTSAVVTALQYGEGLIAENHELISRLDHLLREYESDTAQQDTFLTLQIMLDVDDNYCAMEKDLLEYIYADGLLYSSNYLHSDGITVADFNTGTASKLNPRGGCCMWFFNEGKWIYYLNECENNNLYRIHVDTSRIELIIETDIAFYRIEDGWIYFTQNDEEGDILKGIYRVQTNGTFLQRVTTSGASGFHLEGGWVYFSSEESGRDNTGLRKVRLDGSQESRICDIEASCICVHGDWVYCIRRADSCLYRISKDGTACEKLGDHKIHNYRFVGDHIYYQKMNNRQVFMGIYRMGLDGTEKSTITDAVTYDFCICEKNEWVYFVLGSDYSRLYRIRTDGSGLEKLTNYPIRNVQIHDGDIYFIAGAICYNLCKMVII